MRPGGSFEFFYFGVVQIRRALREDIDKLENRLLFLNLLAAPGLIGIFGLWFARSRKK